MHKQLVNLKIFSDPQCLAVQHLPKLIKHSCRGNFTIAANPLSDVSAPIDNTQKLISVQLDKQV
jgi:hypothetical protein